MRFESESRFWSNYQKNTYEGFDFFSLEFSSSIYRVSPLLFFLGGDSHQQVKDKAVDTPVMKQDSGISQESFWARVDANLSASVA